MNRVRCTICRLRLPSWKKLKAHYLKQHSKLQLIKSLIRTSIWNSTPKVISKAKVHRDEGKYKTIYLHDKVQITCSDDTIVIEDDSSDDNLIELTFDDTQNFTFPTKDQITKPDDLNNNEICLTSRKTGTKRKSKKNKKMKKLFHIGIKKVTEMPRSLHEHTGEFYECHCMEKGAQKTDNESGSDAEKRFYCNFCGNTFSTIVELSEHESIHQYYCKLCNQVFNIPSHLEHLEQHIVKVYVCHLCGFEFVCKEVLIGHLGYHFEQQTFEHILDMERDYNMYGFCNTTFSSGDYYSNINNILFFLTYPYDHYYSRNMFMKVVCDICYQEFYIYDYERHLKIVHFLR